LVWLVAVAGSALLPSTAAAGGRVNVPEYGSWAAGLYNLSPYRFTLEKTKCVQDWPFDHQRYPSCWVNVPNTNPPTSSPPASLAPGKSGPYYLLPNTVESDSFGGEKVGYNAWFTYRVDRPGAAPVYMSLSITGCSCSGSYGSSIPLMLLWFNSQPPNDSWQPTVNDPGTPGVPGNGGITFTNNGTPTAFDLVFGASGNFMIDASTPQGQPFVDALNAICPPQDSNDQVLVGGSCSFDQKTPITYEPATLSPDPQYESDSCVGGPLPNDSEDPTENDPNWAEVDFEAAQSASLSVGGGITESVEFELFGTIASEASVSVEAEHEWVDVQTYQRSTRLYVPANSRGLIWVAPTVAQVTGTLTATIGSATFTAINFTETRSGVTGPPTDPLHEPIPAFNVVTKTRPMTADERTSICHQSGAARLLSRLQAPQTKAPARLVPGRSVAHVALGDTDTTVLRRLGWPAARRFPLHPCQGMKGCTAVRGRHGTFNYKKRNLTVVFGPDRRVAALVYRGNLTTRAGVGKDDTMARLRGAFPRISCVRFAERIDCTVKHVSGQQTVRTVFRLTDRDRGSATRWKTDKTLIYVDGGGRGNT
jgi:hypothetical protein